MDKISEYEQNYNKKRELYSLVDSDFSTAHILFHGIFYFIINFSNFIILSMLVLNKIFHTELSFYFISYLQFSFSFSLLIISFVEGTFKNTFKTYFNTLFFKFDLSLIFEKSDWFFKHKDEAKKIRTFFGFIFFINEKRNIEIYNKEKNKNEIEKLERYLEQLECDIFDDENLTKKLFQISESEKPVIKILSENIKQKHLKEDTEFRINLSLERKFKKTVKIS